MKESKQWLMLIFILGIALAFTGMPAIAIKALFNI